MSVNMKTLPLFLLLVPSVAFAEFSSDVTPEYIRKLNGDILFSELAVGESAFLGFPFCWVDSKLYVDGESIIDENPSEFSLNFKVTRLPQGKVSADIVFGQKYDKKRLIENITGILRIDRTCERRGRSASALFVVDTISGTKTSRELIEKFIK